MVSISKRDTLKAMSALYSLTNETRLKIIDLLLQRYRVGMTPTAIAKVLDLSLPTVTKHLEILEDAGLVNYVYTRGGTPSKLYKIVDLYLTVQIDLSKFVKAYNRSELERKAAKYVQKKMETQLPSNITIGDIQTTLDTDQDTAYVVFEFIHAKEENLIIKPISSMIFDILEKKDKRQLGIEELNKINADEHWIEKACRHIQSKGIYTYRDKKLSRVEVE
ncbi:MAG: winged helix-turn-helix domain-containing protein [Euryarchaeota archaeon]|nr:winged helix-turn-helix domain-containing protein [Euryarchaeota archaeon]